MASVERPSANSPVAAFADSNTGKASVSTATVAAASLGNVWIARENRRDRFAGVTDIILREHGLTIGLQHFCGGIAKIDRRQMCYVFAGPDSEHAGSTARGGVIIAVMRPCAIGARTIRMWSCRGRLMSSTKRPRPRNSGSSSSRGKARPITAVLRSASGNRVMQPCAMNGTGFRCTTPDDDLQ